MENKRPKLNQVKQKHLRKRLVFFRKKNRQVHELLKACNG